MRVFTKDSEKYVSTKCTIETFDDYIKNGKATKSYRFTGTAVIGGLECDVAGFIAKSLGQEYEPGQKVSITCKGSILDGTDPSLEEAKPCNWLWSISRGGADDLQQSQLDAIKALLA